MPGVCVRCGTKQSQSVLIKGANLHFVREGQSAFLSPTGEIGKTIKTQNWGFCFPVTMLSWFYYQFRILLCQWWLPNSTCWKHCHGSQLSPQLLATSLILFLPRCEHTTSVPDMKEVVVHATRALSFCAASVVLLVFIALESLISPWFHSDLLLSFTCWAKHVLRKLAPLSSGCSRKLWKDADKTHVISFKAFIADV